VEPPDAGVMEPEPVVLQTPPMDLGATSPGGCGCTAPGALPFALLALLAFRRRKS
jgi:uncharacterized protein (TIGR03382 family)